MLIDSHAHITSEALKAEAGPLLERARHAGVETIINICTNPEEVERGLALEEEFPWVRNAAATTPHDVEKEGSKVYDQMAGYALSGKLIAIGETGLDYHYFPETKQIQQVFLRRYLRLALKCALPVVIHCRDAFSDFFEILDAEYCLDGKHQPGVLHCFTGTLEEAKQVIERGWYLSLSGIVTFKKSHILQEIAKSIPLEQLLIETDAPYLAPIPHRGKRNEPAFLADIAKFIAELRGISFDSVAEATSQNTRHLFQI